MTQNTCKTNYSRPLVNEPKQLLLTRRTAEKNEHQHREIYSDAHCDDPNTPEEKYEL